MSQAAAMNIYRQYIKEQLGSCNKVGLAKALHAIQDSFAIGHSGYKSYDGLSSLTMQHIIGDFFLALMKSMGLQVLQHI